MTNQFTVTEFRNRIRPIAWRCAQMEGVHNVRFEIDCRTIPVATPELPTHAEAFPEGDDLSYEMSFNDPKRFLEAAGVLQHGAVVHLRVSTTGDWGELRNVFTIWMGTPDADAVIIHAPGFTPDVELVKEEPKAPTTFNTIVIGSGWWGAGNSIEEAKSHAPNWVVTELTGYEVLEFDTPIFDIACNTLGGLTWTYEGSTLGNYTVTEVEPV